MRTGTADDGVWLQVFDARNALDGRPATAFVPGAGLMAMRLGTTDDLSVTRGHVTVADGRAVVTFADDMVTHVHFVDLRALFDDDAATTFVPATAHQGSYIEEATFGLNNFYREGVMTVMQGHHAWTGATRTVVGVDAAKAFDDDPGTKVDQPDSCGIPGISCISPRIQVGVPSQPIFPESLRVYGTRLYSAGSSRMSVWDISTPSQPRIVATHAFADTFGTGCMVEGHSVGWSLPAGIDVAGSRVFINKADGLNVLELE